jgi:hypothetical protein
MLSNVHYLVTIYCIQARARYVFLSHYSQPLSHSATILRPGQVRGVRVAFSKLLPLLL